MSSTDGLSQTLKRNSTALQCRKACGVRWFAMTRRAARYLRQSPTQNPEEGIDRQDARTLGLVQMRGWIDAGTYTDPDVSASKDRGPGTDWHRMLEDAKAGKIDVVVGVDLDRVLRTTRDLNTLIDHGLAVVTVDGEIDLTTADGEFRATMLAGIARFEVRRKGERQRRAQQQRAEAGRPAKGVRLTGYTVGGEAIEAEAAVVRRMFDQFAAGDTLLGIARRLEADGISTRRGAPWSSSSVSTILRNARYAGRSVYKGADVGAAQWPALVSEAQFAAVQARLTDPRRTVNRADTARKHIGSGVYRCTCGLPVRSSSGLGAGMHRYTCRNACFYRSGRPVDDYVRAVIRGRLAMPDLRELLVKPADESELAALNTERDELRHRLRSVESDYDEGLIDGRRYKAAVEKIEARLDEVRRQSAKLVADSGPGSVLAAPDPVAAFDASPLAIRQRVIDALATITLTKGKHGSRTFNPETVQIAWH